MSKSKEITITSAMPIPGIDGNLVFSTKTLDADQISCLETLGFVGGRCYYVAEFSSVPDAKTARNDAGKAHIYVNKGRDKEAKVAEYKTIIAELQPLMNAAFTAKDYPELDRLGALLKKATSGLEKAENGTTGDRANPLPPFESSQAVIRGKNGERVLAIRGDAIPEREKHGLSESWHVFRADEGYWTYQLHLGAHTSWSALNQAISTKVLGGNGTSIGVNGLEALTGTNLETIRTTQLRGFPK